jgi:hypothetical protein
MSTRRSSHTMNWWTLSRRIKTMMQLCGNSDVLWVIKVLSMAWQGLQWLKVQCAGRIGEWGDYDWTSFGHCSRQPCDLCCLCKRAWPSWCQGMEMFPEPC